MNIPFSMLKGAGGGKSAALLAMLAGLVLVTVMKNSSAKAATQPNRSPL